MHYRGLTWDHPRGSSALRAAAAGFSAAPGPDTLEWDVHSLEGFESAPIEEACRGYDLVVLDHPHLGDALAAGVLRPLDEVVAVAGAGGRGALEGSGALDSRSALDSRGALDSSGALDGSAFVGRSWESYVVDGSAWALPLDAAAQVAAADPSAVDTFPDTWDDVEEFARSASVSLSLAGPHALLTLYSLCVAAGGAPGGAPGPEGRLDPGVAGAAIERMRRITSTTSAGLAGELAALNPIAMIERIARRTDIVYTPLVYGYVNYSRVEDAHAVQFGEAPRDADRISGPRGSVLGGTGLAVTRQNPLSPALVDHLLWLVAPATQSGFIPDHDGQPSLASAWTDDRVNAESRDFYRSTLETLTDAWVRPRFAGYTAFQGRASGLVRDAALGLRSVSETLDAVEALRAAAAAASGAPATTPHPRQKATS